MQQVPLEYGKHCTVPFGAYVQASNETTPTNTNARRTIDAIYLHPNTNQQGGHELMNLGMDKVITQRKVMEIPITDLVIKAVECMAALDKVKSLKFTNKHGI